MHIVRVCRQLVRVCFAIILFCVLALGPGHSAGASPVDGTGKAGPNDLRVSGRYLLSANGVNFVMRGVNYPHTWFTEPEYATSFGHIKAKGANTVRVVLSSGHALDWTENSASDVANVIQLCKANKLICVLEVHDTSGYGEWPEAVSLAQAVEYWKKIKSALIGQEAYVIINIGNEPYGNPPENNPNATLAWVDATKNAILALRNAGFGHMLMVDAPNWGQDWQLVMRNNAAGIFNTDPLRNTVFSIHMYEVFEEQTYIQDYLSFFVNAGLPLVIGEFAHIHGETGDPDEDAILAAAEAMGIGYLGWSWSGNCCDAPAQELDMVVDFNPSQQTPWGTRIIDGPNGIRQTSREASVYSGDRNPVVTSIRRGKPNPTSGSQVSFTVTFSEAVTGVNTTGAGSDFALTTTGVTGASIAGVSGSGATRVVTVNTGSGSGTVRLDVVDNGSIKDATNNSLGGPQTGNGDFTSGDVHTITKPANVDVAIGGVLEGQYFVAQANSTRQSFPGLDNGPVKLTHTASLPMIAAERVIYRVDDLPASFTEMMGLPASQLDTTYWLPWYNNIGLDTQLRIANVSTQSASVRVFIGGVEMQGSPFALAAGASMRKSFPGIDAGPVQIQSNRNIVAAERVIYKVNGTPTSFAEMMALPNKLLSNIYWLPWYNNKDFETQLRIGNVGTSTATVRVFIGGLEMSGSPFTLAPGASARKSYTGIDSGPVKIESNGNIVAAERVIYKANGTPTSFTEMMALPQSQLSTNYWLPWYNNVGLETQLRIANVSTSTATVHVFIGGAEMPGSPFNLAAGTGVPRSYAGVDDGAVNVVSSQPVVVSERVIYKVNGANTSLSEMMALPNGQLGPVYWLPWYNNLGLDTQLRFGVP